MPQAGDIEEIKISHPVGDVTLYPKQNEDFTVDYGGLRTEDDDDAIDGSGRPIDRKRYKRGFIEGPISWDMLDRDEVELLNGITKSPERADVTVTHHNGAVFAGQGQVVGSLQPNLGTGQMDLKISGGKFDRIAP